MYRYFKEIENKVKVCYSIAENARNKDLDPKSVVEISIATSLAQRALALIATKYPQVKSEKIEKRIRELEKKYGFLDHAVCLCIAEEIAKEKFCKFKDLHEAIDAGIRVAFAYYTLGVVVPPLEGLTHFEEKKTKDGKDYWCAYYSGPIRSAGVTATIFSLVIIDYLRESFGYEKYDPTEIEIKRIVTEVQDYHERVTNLQYLASPEELTFLVKNLPIQVDGLPSEEREVSNYKDLERISTNRLRNGICLVLSECLAQKAPKLQRIVSKLRNNGFKLSAWDFLDEFVDFQKKIIEQKKQKATGTYIKDLVAGRPIFGHPSWSGAFRLRYGRTRFTGFSAMAVNPATMKILNEFIAVGTQIRLEKPTKAAVISPCDAIKGPIVKLLDGSVVKADTFEKAEQLKNKVQEIIYAGDLLISYGDFFNRNQSLLPCGYNHEWWLSELKEVAIKYLDPQKLIAKTSAQLEAIQNALGGLDKKAPDIGDAIRISRVFNIPLHPDYTFFWSQINFEQFIFLLEWFSRATVKEQKFNLPYETHKKEGFAPAKRALELIGAEHIVATADVVLEQETANIIAVNFGIKIEDFRAEMQKILEKAKEFQKKFKKDEEPKVLEFINNISSFKIKDLAGTFIGARMGRPEKAKPRELKGSPNVLFPVSKQGGRLRSVNAAMDLGFVESDFPIYYCENCKKESIYFVCKDCGGKTRKMYYCRDCGKKILTENCPLHGPAITFAKQKLPIKEYFKTAVKNLGLEQIPPLIKGVRGTSSINHTPEHLAKGLLRAVFSLHVNKDGTVRYDAIETPVTQFKPKEVGVSPEKLRELGYTKDIFGKEVRIEEQILELKPHDIILPCFKGADEPADETFFKVSKFVDAELAKFYGMKSFYNLKKKEDLAGHLVLCMAPHNCAGVVGRIIGFSNTQGFFASPYMHAAMRRDCFDYNTYMPIKQNKNWRIMKIGELVEELNPKKIVDNFGTKEKKVNGFSTIGFDKKLNEVKINNFTKHTKTSLLEIKTALGKRIIVTKNHKFLVDGKKKRAGDLRIKDKLPLPLKINIKPKKLDEINLIEFLKNENLMVRGIKNIIGSLDENKRKEILDKLNITNKQFQNFNIRDSYPLAFILRLDKKIQKEISKKGKLAAKRDKVTVPITIKLDKKLLEVIGLYVAEGYSRSVGGRKGLNQVYIAAIEKEIRNLISITIKKHFGLKTTENKKDRLVFSSKILYLFFTKILEAGSTARSKRIPYLFLNLTKKKLADVLRGYFEGDGSAEKNRKKISCDSVSEGLLNDIEFCLARFGIFAKRYEYEKEPGPAVKEFYIRKNRKIPKFKITKLTIGSDFVKNFRKIGFLSTRKNKILENYKNMGHRGMRIDYDANFIYDSIISIIPYKAKKSYCLNVENKNHLVIGNSIISHQCDGDEAAMMLMLDALLNFSREYLPAHRGATQDAPLILNARIRPAEVDDMIFDMECVKNYPLEFYMAAEKSMSPISVKIEQISDRIKSSEEFAPFKNFYYTHETDNLNVGVMCSAYKTLATMQEKLDQQMDIAKKLRAVDTSDVARLVIERHFIRDLKGNFNKFTKQRFRCVKCNEKYRRPPLEGKCIKCGGRIIFTISEGSIVKYLEPAINLAKTYNVPLYVRQNLELLKKAIESVFGREKEKQQDLNQFFKPAQPVIN